MDSLSGSFPEQSQLLSGARMSTYVERGRGSHDVVVLFVFLKDPCAICRPPPSPRGRATGNELLPAAAIKSRRNCSCRNPGFVLSLELPFLLQASGLKLGNSIWNDCSDPPTPPQACCALSGGVAAWGGGGGHPCSVFTHHRCVRVSVGDGLPSPPRRQSIPFRRSAQSHL